MTLDAYSKEFKYFDGKRYRLVKKDLNRTEANHWRNEYLNKGYRVRVLRGTALTTKNKYYIYRR